MDEERLLTMFNERNNSAFTTIYSKFYVELHYYAIKIYKGTNIDPQDSIQDVFLKLWQSKNTVFSSQYEIKSYLYISLRNDFNNFIKKNNHNFKYIESQIKDSCLFEANIIESEIFSYFSYLLDMLPKDSADILRLFFNGWSAEEITLKTGWTKQTIYNKKHKAIKFFQEKICKDKVLLNIILTLIK